MNLEKLSDIALRLRFDEIDKKPLNPPDLEFCYIPIKKNFMSAVLDGTGEYDLACFKGYTVEIEGVELIVCSVEENYRMWMIAEKSTGLFLGSKFYDSLYTISGTLNMHHDYFKELALQLIEMNPEIVGRRKRVLSEIYKETNNDNKTDDI